MSDNPGAVWALTARRVLVLVSAVAILAGVLAGCSSGETPVATPSTTTTTTAPGLAVEGSTECASSTQLNRVFMSADATLLYLTWESDPPVTTSERSYVVTLGSKQIGLKFVGREVFRYVFDMAESKPQINLESAYTESDGRATLVVPLSAIGELDDPVRWWGVTTRSGADLGRCPEVATIEWTGAQ
jgi:hypothetical protein